MTIDTMDKLCFIYINSRSIRKLKGIDDRLNHEKKAAKEEAKAELLLLQEDELISYQVADWAEGLIE
jgi:hypothetical protein